MVCYECDWDFGLVFFETAYNIFNIIRVRYIILHTVYTILYYIYYILYNIILIR
jgi:hypothetical protein